MAIIMAAMSGIIGGEIVLLGLIALPNMLRLGYDQNLAIGTICASGSLGTMIPPSIVLIIYGLVTETSIYALFQAAFIPGFRSEEHTSELQSLMRISYAVFCLKKKK